MLYEIIIVLGLAFFMLNLFLNLKNLRTPSINSKVPRPAPLISVLIPARNEEDNIGGCVESLQQQDYPNFEVLVLDDNSEDSTSAIVSKIAAKDSRVKLLHGQPLQNGWVGKPYACYQLAKKAQGSWLLFVDADTTHAPHMLRSVLSLAMELKTSLLSGFPRQLTNAFAQKVTIPVFYFILLSWVPIWLLHRAKKPRPSIGIGQFFFFSRDEYWRMGGHMAVKDRLVEDMWMGVEISRHGGRHVAVDLSPVVSCTMYRDIKSTWNGLGKSIYEVAAVIPVALAALVCIAYLFYIAPFFGLWSVFFSPTQVFLWRGLVGAQIIIILLMRWMVENRFRESPVSLWFHPIGLIFYLANVLYSGGRWLIGAGITWKERFYGKEQTIE